MDILFGADEILNILSAPENQDEFQNLFSLKVEKEKILLLDKEGKPILSMTAVKTTEEGNLVLSIGEKYKGILGKHKQVLDAQDDVPSPSPEPHPKSGLTKKEKYTAYFQELLDELREQHNFTQRRPIEGQNYCLIASGTTDIRYVAGFNENGEVYTALGIHFKSYEKNKNFFDVLKERESKINVNFDVPLYWQRRDENVRSVIGLWRERNIESNASELEAFRAWHVENLLKFKSVFTPEIQRALGKL